jgi:hypothetical protein
MRPTLYHDVCLAVAHSTTRTLIRRFHFYIHITLQYMIRTLDGMKYIYSLISINLIFSLLGGMYPSYCSLYQAGENAYGSVVILIRQTIIALHF